ncbi:MAG: FIST C-terminal domain-containing protein [Flavobacteriales bacterium]|nr:FIST C-terminal domain-containing protein [Flavobacteriales bacterium]
MKTSQFLWKPESGWTPPLPTHPVNNEKTWILAFGNVDRISDPGRFEELHQSFPVASIMMCSTAGEIAGHHVLDGTIVATVVVWEKTTFRTLSLDVNQHSDSFACGKAIRAGFPVGDLAHIFLISDGISVNGDELVRGINLDLPPHVLVTGALAADAGRFKETFVGLNEIPKPGKIAAIGFYGHQIKVGHGSMGGWDEFGPVRVITRSKGNVLYELDGHNALELYKKYLGERADQLPGSALLFPLSILTDDSQHRIVRTILSIDEQGGSMTFAGDLPMGSRVQFMMANFDRLIDGASTAAEFSSESLGSASPDLVVMISCVGRKIVLDQRIEEEVESVNEVFGEKPSFTGFYSNGEISPVTNSVACSLHNQTMTITTYTEA